MGRALSFITLVLLACSSSDPAPPAAVESAEPAPPAPAEKPAPKPIVIRGQGLDKPESVLHDAVADVYLVTNIVGKSLEKDGNGFISRLSPDGKVLDLKWIDGGKRGVSLDAPKGMAISGDTLYVADIDTLRAFDRETGKPKSSIKIKGATFLNDVAVDDRGQVFVSDSGLEQWGPYTEPNGKDAIYRVDGKKATALVKDKALGNPNGLLADGGALYVVNKLGELYRVDGGSKTDITKLPAGSLDGIVKTPAGIMISSWDAKAVFLQSGDKFEPVLEDVSSPADIGYDSKRNRLLAPVLTEKTVRIEMRP